MEVLVIVALLGHPTDEVHEDLTRLMRERLGWDTHIMGINGVTAPLPSAIYAGETELELLELATNLMSQITAEIWRDGARVLVLQRLDWAGVGTG